MQNPIAQIELMSSHPEDRLWRVDGKTPLYVNRVMASVFAHTPACFRYRVYTEDGGTFASYEGADLSDTTIGIIAERYDANTFKRKRVKAESMGDMDAQVLFDALDMSRKNWDS